VKNSIEHLPADKQAIIHRTLSDIIRIIEPEIVILYGSYATGNWVEDRYTENHVTLEYRSDYDYLVITKDDCDKYDMWINAIQMKHLAKYQVEVNIICYSVEYVNSRLSEGMFFFSDIQQQGIVLFDTNRFSLTKKRQLAAAEKKAIAREHFDIWFPAAQSAWRGANFYLEEGDLYEADFMLHRSMESAYNAILPIFWGNRPKTHNLDKLRQFGKPYSIELMKVFPKNSEYEVHLFNQLKKGYIHARYKRKSFIITKEEVQELINRMKTFLDITERICLEKIASFDAELQP
jgi:HEPN domain-containing protein/predicted nucleotidyltransferase